MLFFSPFLLLRPSRCFFRCHFFAAAPKQLHWIEALKIQNDQYEKSALEARKKAKKDAEEKEKNNMLQMKTARELELANDELKR